MLDTQGVRVFAQAHFGEQLTCADKCFFPVNDAFAGTLVAQVDVLGNGEVRDQCQLLMDNDDSQILALLDAFELACFPLK